MRVISRVFMLAIILLPLLIAPVAIGQDDPLQAKVQLALRDMTGADESRFWGAVQAAQALGDDAVEPLRVAAAGGAPWMKLGCANALAMLDEPKDASAILTDLLKDGASDEALGSRGLVTAVSSLAGLAKHLRNTDEIKASLDAVRGRAADPYVQIALLEAGYVIDRNGEVKTELRKYFESTDVNLKYAAALALARMGETESTRDALEAMARETSARGDQARAFLKVEELIAAMMEGDSTDENTAVIKGQQQKISKLENEVTDLKNRLADAKKGIGVQGQNGEPLLDELMMMIQQLYIDPEKTKKEDLVAAAAKGMARALDPHSNYLTEKDLQDFDQSLNQRYKGIGVYVEQRNDGAIVITQPVYSGPAYKAGLQSGDIITDVESVSVMGKEMDEVVKMIKGEEGTPVTIKVYREGWPEARAFTITRAAIHVDDVLFTMLPGAIGYIRQTTFGEDTATRIGQAIQELKKQGMTSLVFDLRDNSGGILDEAVKIAGFFLGKDKVVVEVRSRIKMEQMTHKTMTDLLTDAPMTVLINDNSASASEALSGCLRDHGRATLIGVKTFGKGTVQRLFQVSSTAGKTRLRLTFAKYHLPNGETPHEVGVKPDIEIASARLPYWTVPEIDKLRESNEIAKYVTAKLADNPDRMAELAITDHRDTAEYPGFDEFFRALNTKLDPDHVRLLVRREVRLRVSDIKGERFVTDLEEDVQLQRAVTEVLGKLNVDPKSIHEYADFAEAAK